MFNVYKDLFLLWNCDFVESGMAVVFDRFRSWNFVFWIDLVRISSYVTYCRLAFDDD